jgi:hypothetical protein
MVKIVMRARFQGSLHLNLIVRTAVRSISKTICRIAKYLDLNDAQKAAFKKFHEARRKSLEDSKAALCASKPDLSSFEARLAFGQSVLEARLAALKAENPKLIAFYNRLDAKQKEKCDRFRERQGLE